MLLFIARKIPTMLMLALVTSIIAFILPRLAPGDPAVAALGSEASLEQIEAYRLALGLDKSIPLQYLTWVGNLLRGDLGVSLANGRPVAELIGNNLGSTLQLTIAAVIVMVVAGFLLGGVAGSARGRVSKSVADWVISILIGVPGLVIGLVSILLLGVVYPIFPVGGEVSIFDNPWLGVQFLTLPALAIGLHQAGTVARLIEAKMLSVRQEEFVQMAISKGVSRYRVTWHHVLRNSMGTAAVAIGIRIGELLGGAVVAESIFARNGLGLLAVHAIQTRDYTVVQVLILGAVLIAGLMNILSEIVLAALDPRVRLGA